MASCKLYRGRLALKWPDVNDIGEDSFKMACFKLYLGRLSLKGPVANYIGDDSL
jgi:hypothetical protein